MHLSSCIVNHYQYLFDVPAVVNAMLICGVKRRKVHAAASAGGWKAMNIVARHPWTLLPATSMRIHIISWYEINGYRGLCFFGRVIWSSVSKALFLLSRHAQKVGGAQSVQKGDAYPRKLRWNLKHMRHVHNRNRIVYVLWVWEFRF